VSNPTSSFFQANPARAAAIGVALTFAVIALVIWSLWSPNRDLRALALSALACAALLAVWLLVLRAIHRNQAPHPTALPERQALEDQIQSARQSEGLGVLAGGIAHDFNNLLTGIMSNAGTARHKLAASDSAQQHLREIVQGAKMAAHLTGQLLAYAGKGKFHVQARDLTAEVLEIRELLEASVRGEAILEFKLGANLPGILADPTQFHQILMNLIINASESSDHEVLVRVETSVCDLDEGDIRELVAGSTLTPGPSVILEVSDTGPGISPEALERIFDPYYTTKSRGRGLGLSATLGIVHRHSGGLRVTSRAGEGTSFRVAFPASDALVRPPAEQPPTEVTGSGLILIVDDDDYILQAVEVSLQSFGYSVLRANSGAAAIQIFQEQSEAIDLVLLDMLMPGMSGEETFRALGKIRSDVKVVLSTGYAPDQAAQRFNEKGLAGFLRKPYDPDQLAAEIQRILEWDAELPSAELHEALRDLRASYRAKLPEQIEELVEQLRVAREPDGMDALTRAQAIAHRLTGTSGSYGLEAVSATLAHVDTALIALLEDATEIDRWVEIDRTLDELLKQLPAR
jgi:signal transduction histidine kinase/CheY-like chemotaxis protein